MGTIRSRNFLSEYGKTANSLWRFASHDWQNYALILDIKKLRLFYWDGDNQICLGSYNLTIDGDQENCTEFVLEYRRRYIFYNSPTCLNVSVVSINSKKKFSKFPLNVKYESDGRTIDGVTESGEIWGFEMDYKFIKCPDSPYVTTEAATTPDTTTVDSTTTVQVETTESERTTQSEQTEEYLTSRKLTVTQVKTDSHFSTSIEEFFTAQILQTTNTKYYEEGKTKREGIDIRLLTIILEIGAGFLGLAIILTLAFGCKRNHEKRNPRSRRQSEAPLCDKLTFELDSPLPTEQGFPYSINGVRTFSQCSDDRLNNQYASIHEANWRDTLDYVTMAEVADENADGNAIYASVTFNPNINDQEITEYAPMTGNLRSENRYEEWSRHASVPTPIYARPKSLMKDNSVYVIVTDNQNNNEYVMPSGLKITNAVNPDTGRGM